MQQCEVHAELVQLVRSLPALKEPSLVSPESQLRALHVVASHFNVSVREARHLVDSLRLEADISVTYENIWSVTSFDYSAQSEEVLTSTTAMKKADYRKLGEVRSNACTSDYGGVDKDEHLTFGNLVAGELRNLRCPHKRNKLKCLILKAILQVCEEGDLQS